MAHLVHKHSFTATDRHGGIHTIDVFVELVSQSTFANPQGTFEGLKHLRTLDGESVNRLGLGKYELVQSGEVLTSDDPLAP